MHSSPLREPRLSVAVLGATGLVGQRFVALLERHPWFEIVALTGSGRSVGRRYGEVVEWALPGSVPERVAALELRPTTSDLPVRIAFSALDAELAGPLETELARAGVLVVSNAKSHRLDPDVPLVVPEVNPDHLALLPLQGFGRGGIITNPNCSTIGLVLALKPLVDAFGVERVLAVTLQARSGAGLAGLANPAFDANVIPFIGGEEEKIEVETQKILGALERGSVRAAGIPVSAHCNRVAVTDGHTICVSVALARQAAPDEVVAAWRDFRAEPQALALPTAPELPVRYLEERDAPQPRLHRDVDGGMAAHVGRLRPCPLLGYKFVTLSHNAVRGAAGGALLAAELAVAKGFV